MKKIELNKNFRLKINNDFKLVQNSAFNLIDIKPINPTELKIKGFAGLPLGWNFGRGTGISPPIIENALKINKTAIDMAFYETDAFPGDNGEIMVTIYYQEYYLEFTIESDGEIIFYQELKDEEIKYRENLTLNDILKIITQFRANIWKRSGLLAADTMIAKRNDLPALRSKTSEVIREYPLSTKIVSSTQETPSVNILESITEIFQASRQSSGTSKQTFSLMATT